MRPSSAIAVVALSALTLPVVVVAESKIEPHASSPAGAVYEIPLQTARDFGAPGGGTGSGSSGSATQNGAGVLPGAGVKSENGYGSSSRVPGLSAAAARADARAGSPAAHASGLSGVALAGAAAASLGSGSATTGSSATQQPASPRPIEAIPASTDTPSLTNAYGLVALIVLGGGAAGLAAASATRRGRRST